MPFPFALSRGLLLCAPIMLCSAHTRHLLIYFFQVAIGICNITSIVILRPVIFAHTAGPFEVIAAASSILALLVFPITFSFLYCRRHAEASNTRNLITFGVLCLSDLTSCILLTVHARRNNASALCRDLSQSGDCTMANALLAVFYMSVIFAIIGFVLACFDKRPGITKLSPRYPITKASSSHFAAFQYPLDELEGVYSDVYSGPSSQNAKYAKKARTQERWTEIPL
ncbi:hypothetical protein P692DRAFT_20737121 [Suillus brevipes Sb2]|nr:hypothetical protein P692DRAFT_20737121 [Suillus brevipes Sb2]